MHTPGNESNATLSNPKSLALYDSCSLGGVHFFILTFG